MRGMAAMSWNSSTANAASPVGDARKPRSRMVCTAIAVDDSARARPATSAACQGSPTARPPSASRPPQTPICNAPPPNTARRMLQSCFGSSSRPMRNSISTTPNSAKCRMAPALRTRRNPQGPITQPAIR